MRAALLLGAGLAGLGLWASRRRPRAAGIERISRVVADLARSETFYRDGLGFQRVSGGPGDPALSLLLGLGRLDSETVSMRLGGQTIELVRFATLGRPYPPGSRSDDLWFQHMAIVVSDMDAAYRRLSGQPGLQPISHGGPQTLPPSTGGVRAFKFRDPDGHPLELIWFPPGQGRALWHDGPAATPFLGIDHSGLAVGGTRRSLRFYRRLGFRVAYRSLNRGAAQERLDGLPGACARITGLRLADPVGPGLELLGYEPPGRATAVAGNDMAADWVTLRVAGLRNGTALRDGARARLVRDPDGHRLLLLGSGAD
jgi:catechol 2,3-dioxygenase-like lactoylglutathione lyase family enzyme